MTGRLDDYEFADYVRRVVDAAPPLTDAQRNQCAALLRPESEMPSPAQLKRWNDEHRREIQEREKAAAETADPPAPVAPVVPVDVATALYRYWDAEKTLLYVGVATDVRLREYQHVKGSKWMRFQSERTEEWFPSRPAALEAEKAAIRAELPIFNTVYADDQAGTRAVEYLAEHKAWDMLSAGRWLK